MTPLGKVYFNNEMLGWKQYINIYIPDSFSTLDSMIIYLTIVRKYVQKGYYSDYKNRKVSEIYLSSSWLLHSIDTNEKVNGRELYKTIRL